MVIKKLVLASGLALAIGGAALAQPNAKPILVKSKALDAMVAKTKDGLASAKVPTGAPNHVMMIAHRKADGEVEVHTKLADEIRAELNRPLSDKLPEQGIASVSFNTFVVQ